MNTAEQTHAEQFTSREQQSFAGTFGMWVFITSELLFFGPLLFAYLYFRVHFPEASAAASRHTDYLLGTVNTAVLLTSSFLMALAGQDAEAGRCRRARRLLWTVAALGIVFLVLKGWEYRNDFHEQLFPGPGFRPEQGGHAQQLPGMQLFFILYFLLTGLHAVHLTIGILVCLALAVRLRHPPPIGASADAIEYAGLYWHFVDLVWIFLYPLLYLVGRAGG
jgi:cytochrome c oxidase subunit 3